MTRPPLGRSNRASSSGHSNAIIDPSQPSRRARIQLRRIPDEKQRRCTFQKRKKGLLKKASELAMMCDVQLCLLSTGHADPQLDDKVDVKFDWSVPNTTVEEILDRYEATPQEQRDKKKLDYISHLELQIKKTEKESENMKQLNANLEEEIYKKVVMDIQSIVSTKLQVDARLRALSEEPQGGMTGEVDQTRFYQQDVPLYFQNSNQVAQEFNPHSGLPLAIPGLPQYGSANFIDESRFAGNNEAQGHYHYGATSIHPGVNMGNEENWDPCNWGQHNFGSPSKST